MSNERKKELSKIVSPKLQRVFDVMEEEGITFEIMGETYVRVKDVEETFVLLDLESDGDGYNTGISELPPCFEYKLRVT